MVKIQLLSDIRLEFLGGRSRFEQANVKQFSDIRDGPPWVDRLRDLPVLAPILVLTGDIGILQDDGKGFY